MPNITFSIRAYARFSLQSYKISRRKLFFSRRKDFISQRKHIFPKKQLHFTKNLRGYYSPLA